MVLPSSRLNPRAVIFLITVCCMIPFFGIARYGLADLDEGFYATVVWEMMSRGDWLLPTYAGEPWLEKPIWLYWVSGIGVSVLGGELGLRAPSVIASLIMAALLARFVERKFSLDRALLTALAYCGSLIVIGTGRMMLTDPWLVLGLCGGLIYWYEGLEEKQAENFFKAGVLLGIGMLAKGPVAMMLFLGVVIAYRLWTKERLGVRFGSAVWLATAFAAVTATWYVPAYLSFPEVFVQNFLIEQNLERFTGGDSAHAVPLWLHPIYFPVVLALGCLPWILVGLRRGQSDVLPPVKRFLWCWLLVVLLFFTVSGSKLPHYILPAVAPAVVLLVLNARGRFQFDRLLVIGCVWCLVMSVVAQAIFQFDWSRRMAAPQALAIESQPIGGRLVAYRLGRQTDEVTIGLTLEQTSHPSLGFYSQSVLLNADSIQEVIAEPDAKRLITRRALDSEEMDALAAAGIAATVVSRAASEGHVLTQDDAESPTDWVLYRLDR